MRPSRWKFRCDKPITAGRSARSTATFFAAFLELWKRHWREDRRIGLGSLALDSRTTPAGFRHLKARLSGGCCYPDPIGAQSMSQEWKFEHSVECPVSPEFAWNFWTNVDNWKIDADVESVELSGPFRPGTHGTTHSKSSGRIEWRIAEVTPPKQAVLEFPAPGAAAYFLWTFEPSPTGTRITQLASLSGERASYYAETFGPSLEAGLPAGMRKLCQAMEQAAREPKG